MSGLFGEFSRFTLGSISKKKVTIKQRGIWDAFRWPQLSRTCYKLMLWRNSKSSQWVCPLKMSLRFWYEEGGNHRNPEWGKGAGNIPGKAEWHSPGAGLSVWLLEGYGPRSHGGEKEEGRGEAGQNCDSLHIFLPPMPQLKQDHGRAWRLPLCPGFGYCQQKVNSLWILQQKRASDLL